MGRLQQFDFASSAYERPNRQWVCGHAADGTPCRLGPDVRGRCCTVAECQPRRDGARWVCTRPASAGGPCDAGPMADGTCAHPIPPCVPVRSQRGLRGQLVRWTVVATIGLLAIVIGPSDLSPLMPGPLTQAHAGLGTCRNCHTAVGQGWTGWIHAAFAPSRGRDDSGRCLECHRAGDNSLKAHGVAQAVLVTATQRIGKRAAAGQARPMAAMVQAAAFPVDRKMTDMLPCATCHVEHRGERADLTAVSESRCQVCHVVQFAGFSSGHPAFDGYPYRRRTRINFDHVAHFARHFPEVAAKKIAGQKPPTACIDCHVPGNDGRLMTTRSFDQTCSACHLGQIRGTDRATGPRGVAVLAVPGLDVQTLRQHGIGIGKWPEFAEARVTPIMALLLSADKEARAALDATAKLDLLDLRSATDAQLAAVGRLAWAVKSLFRELSTKGLAMVRERLLAATGRRPDDAVLARLLVSIPRDVLLGAQRDWFPDLDHELADHAAGKPVPIPGGTPAPAPAAAAPAAPAGPKDQGDILSGAPAPKDQGDILSGPVAPKDQGEILSGAPAAKDQGEILSGAPAPKDQGDILSGAPAPKDQGDILSGAPAEAATAPVTTSPASAAPPPVNEEDFVRLGGWYRQDFQLLFLPTGHADPFMQAWLDFTGSLYGSDGEKFAAPVFAALTAKDAQGQCAKCHSIDRLDSGVLAVNWHPAGAQADAGGFTRFTHAPHMRVVSDRGCLTCHRLDQKAKYLAAFAGTDPRHFASNFRPMERATCARCHTEKAAGEGCLQCHSYHVTPIRTPLMATKVAGALPGAPARSP